MISSGIYLRYARALADVVVAIGSEARVSGDLSLYRDIFAAGPDLFQVFDSPAIAREAKDRILDELLLRYPVGDQAANFLRTLLAHHRIRYFNEIHDAYMKNVNERKGIVAAKVAAASTVSEPDLSRLRTGLEAATGRRITLEVRTDPDLIGGAVVQIESTVYDGSIRRQLAEMRNRLLEG